MGRKVSTYKKSLENPKVVVDHGDNDNDYNGGDAGGEDCVDEDAKFSPGEI